VGLFAAGDGRSSSAPLRTVAAVRQRPNRYRDLSNLKVRTPSLLSAIKTERGARPLSVFIDGGEGGIARVRGRPLVLRCAPDRCSRAATSKIALRFCRTGGSVHTPCSAEIKKDPRRIPFYFSNGGEGGIRTHVPELPDHPISSRRRYDHFGTSPLDLFPAR
jgi:hypothetical protein